MKGFVNNSIRAQENRAAEHGVLWLRKKGRPQARRLCMKKFKDLSGKVSQIPVHVPSIKGGIDGIDGRFLSVLMQGQHLDPPPPSHTTIICRMTPSFPSNWWINNCAQVVAEVDGIAVDEGCAAIVEAKNSLGSAAAESLHAKLLVLR